MYNFYVCTFNMMYRTTIGGITIWGHYENWWIGNNDKEYIKSQENNNFDEAQVNCYWSPFKIKVNDTITYTSNMRYDESLS